jgi:hypothetical protein
VPFRTGHTRTMHHRRRGTASTTLAFSSRNVVSPLLSCANPQEGAPQGDLTGQRVKEEGGSEGRLVTGRIGVEPAGDSTPRETGQTSLWCWCPRTLGQPLGEARQNCQRGVMPLLVRPPKAQRAFAAQAAWWPPSSIVQAGPQAKGEYRVPLVRGTLTNA